MSSVKWVEGIMETLQRSHDRSAVQRVEGMALEYNRTYTHLSDVERAYVIATELYNRTDVFASPRKSYNPKGLMGVIWEACKAFHAEHVRLGGSMPMFEYPIYQDEHVTWSEVFSETL